LTGLAAISAHNGWAIAIAGACIVMVGLSVLSFIISQLPRIVGCFEKRKISDTSSDSEGAAEEKPKVPEVSLTDMEQTVAAYEPLIEELGQPFSLKALYESSGAKGYPHIHLTVKSLREAGKLVPQGDGMFLWDPEGTVLSEEPLPETTSPTESVESETLAENPAPNAVAAPEAPAADPAPAPAVVQAPQAPAVPAPKTQAAAPVGGAVMTAPMPGMIIRYEKQEGETVSEGETVVVLEAMKMENALPAFVSGTITAINFASGDAVAKADVLCVIG
jgi:biotin carboxyl carrier protein